MGIIAGLRHLLVKTIDPVANALYGTCVATSRLPVFYAKFAVPDSLDGRFDLLALHVILVIFRMKDSNAKQNLFDLMFADMDRSLREMGVGDMSIGKKMKPMLAGFYGRAGAYEAALAKPDDIALIAALSRNLYGMKDGTAANAPILAGYVRHCVTALAAQNDADLAAGRLSFPTLV